MASGVSQSPVSNHIPTVSISPGVLLELLLQFQFKWTESKGIKQRAEMRNRLTCGPADPVSPLSPVSPYVKMIHEKTRYAI